MTRCTMVTWIAASTKTCIVIGLPRISSHLFLFEGNVGIVGASDENAFSSRKNRDELMSKQSSGSIKIYFRFLPCPLANFPDQLPTYFQDLCQILFPFICLTIFYPYVGIIQEPAIVHWSSSSLTSSSSNFMDIAQRTRCLMWSPHIIVGIAVAFIAYSTSHCKISYAMECLCISFSSKQFFSRSLLAFEFSVGFFLSCSSVYSALVKQCNIQYLSKCVWPFIFILFTRFHHINPF